VENVFQTVQNYVRDVTAHSSVFAKVRKSMNVKDVPFPNTHTHTHSKVKYDVESHNMNYLWTQSTCNSNDDVRVSLAEDFEAYGCTASKSAAIIAMPEV
jgi:hypothetical protein